MLTVIDKWHRQCVALQADFSLTGQSVVDAMNAIALSRRVAVRDNCRSRNGIYVQGARRMVLPAGREARLHPAWQADRERVHRVVQRTVCATSA